MKAKLIHYNLSKLDQVKKVLVKRLLFGYTEYSNYGKYTYKRKGILEEIPYFKLTKAVVVVKPQDQNKVINVLKKVGAKYDVLDIELKKSMLH